MPKETEPLDIAKLKEAQEPEFESLDFLFAKHPEDNTFYAYRVKPLQEPRQFTSKKGNTYDCADCEILQVVNDKELKAPCKRTLILPHVLKKKLMKYAPITDKTFDIMGKGMVTPKKGRPYYNFAVLFAGGTLAASTLKRLLPISFERKAEWRAEDAGKFMNELINNIETSLNDLSAVEIDIDSKIERLGAIQSTIAERKTQLRKLRDKIAT